MAAQASLIEILEWIDPTALPEHVQVALEQIGPYLALGWTYRMIGERAGHSEDWASARVREIRVALVAEALSRADDMSEALRERLEELEAAYRAGRSVPLTRR